MFTDRIICGPYLLSCDDYNARWKKFPSHRTVSITRNALEKGVLTYNKDPEKIGVLQPATNTCKFPLRSTYNCQGGNKLYTVGYTGVIEEGDNVANTGYGSVYELNILLNPKILLDSFNYSNRETIIYASVHSNKTSGGDLITVSGFAPTVTFGGRKYLWLNQEECVAESSKTMKLQSLNAETQLKRFSMYDNNYAKAVDINKQLEQIAFKHCTPEELSWIVPTQLLQEDNFEHEELLTQRNARIVYLLHLGIDRKVISLETMYAAINLVKEEDAKTKE